MKFLFTTLIIFFIAHRDTNAQTFKYFQYIDEGLQLYHNQKYEDAGKAFDKAINELNGKTTQTNFYNAACAWSLAHNNDKALRYLHKIVDGKMIRGWDDPVEFYDMLKKDADFTNIKSDPSWIRLLKKAERNKNNFLKGIKQDIAGRIKKIGESDQQIRVKLDSVRKKDGLNSAAERIVLVEMKKRDSSNFKAFEEIIRQYGWQGPDEVGYKNNQYLFLILQHAELPAQKAYLPVFKNSCKAGKVLPKDLAYLEDRINMREKKLQQYGSQTLIDNTKKTYLLFPVADIENVDQRRAYVGLESLKSYMKTAFNVNFDIDNYKKELPELKEKYLK